MRRTAPILILVIGVLAIFVDFMPRLRLPALGGGETRTVETKLGLDLEGGLRVEYQALPSQGQTPDAAALSIIRSIIEARVNSIGVAEPVVTTQGSDRVVVELPGVSDPDTVRKLVGTTGRREPRSQHPPGPVQWRPDQ
jgi:preprotein translocase subunit SecD